MTQAIQSHRGPSSIWALSALTAGLLLGAAGHALGNQGFHTLADILRPVGQMWLSALVLLVLPLVISCTLSAVVGMPRDQSAGALFGRALALFVAVLLAGALITLIVAPPVISLFPVDPADIAILKASTPVPDVARQAALAPSDTSFLAWLTGLIPQNLVEAARRGDLLPLLLVALLIAAAVTQLPDEHREPMTRLFMAFAATMLTAVRWLLWFLPVGVFIFMYSFVLGAGGIVAGVVAGLIVAVCYSLLVCTLLYYPLAAMFGRVRLRDFAHAVLPAQVMALSTSSSLASLPALVDSARDRLKLPESATGFVLPLCAALFKPNRTVSSTAKLLVLAHFFGVSLTAGGIAAFVLTVIVLSFSTIGLPGGASAFKTLPAYVAVGIPVEALVIAEAVETIPDLFKTLLNVTANMGVATLLSRSSRAVQVRTTAVSPPQPTAETT
jgi:proton glutamate symport protein